MTGGWSAILVGQSKCGFQTQQDSMPAGFVSAEESKAQPTEKSGIHTNQILTLTNPILVYININTTSVGKYP